VGFFMMTFDFFDNATWHHPHIEVLCRTVLADAFRAGYRCMRRGEFVGADTTAYWMRPDQHFMKTRLSATPLGTTGFTVWRGHFDFFYDANGPIPLDLSDVKPMPKASPSHHLDFCMDYGFSMSLPHHFVYLQGEWESASEELARALFWLGVEGDGLREKIFPSLSFTQESLWLKERALSWKHFEWLLGDLGHEPCEYQLPSFKHVFPKVEEARRAVLA
jgi:hypothetical protein